MGIVIVDVLLFQVDIFLSALWPTLPILDKIVLIDVSNDINEKSIYIFNWRAAKPAVGFTEISEMTESKKWQPLYREFV